MIYKISETSLKERKRHLILMTVMMPFMLIYFFVLFSIRDGQAMDWKFASVIIGGVTAFLILEMFVVGKLMLNRVKKMALTIQESGMMRTGGKVDEVFEFSDMTLVKISRNPDRDEKMIIRCKLASKSITIAGFENMHEIYEAIVEAGVDIEEKPQKIDWSSLQVMGVTLVVMLTIMSALILSGDGIYEWVSPLLQIALAVYFIGFKPISRNVGARFVWFERILGGLIIISSVVIIVSRVLGA